MSERIVADQVLTFYPLSPSDKAFMSCGAVILCCIALWGWATFIKDRKKEEQMSRGVHFEKLSEMRQMDSYGEQELSCGIDTFPRSCSNPAVYVRSLEAMHAIHHYDYGSRDRPRRTNNDDELRASRNDSWFDESKDF
ncbi:hypothetical protein BZA77DRAFT_348705 [Pyronema omphalodes]|nr:hypothetical protein BZA77DRAFT_348705 [Pyronema omphalodes]